jgi:hypothetical protein
VAGCGYNRSNQNRTVFEQAFEVATELPWDERPARNEATALRNRQEFQPSQLTELANTDFESWAKESFEIATKIAYRNGGRIGIPRGGNKEDCGMVTAAPVLPVGYVASARQICWLDGGVRCHSQGCDSAELCE